MDGEPGGLEVMVFSDFCCPFCNVARERVAYLERRHGARVEWRPYDLHPEYPPEGIPREDLVRRYGPALHDAVRRMHEEAGLPYSPHPDVVPNTRRALEACEWARSVSRGAYDRLHTAVMDAYWTRGRDISGWEALGDCVAEAGLDPQAARAAVESGAHAEAVDASTRWAHDHGITAVPAFVLGGRFLVSGAHPHEAFDRAVERLAAEGGQA